MHDANAEALPFDASTVDVIVLCQAVHWFSPIARFLTDCHRCLRNGGVLACISHATPVVRCSGASAVAECTLLNEAGKKVRLFIYINICKCELI